MPRKKRSALAVTQNLHEIAKDNSAKRQKRDHLIPQASGKENKEVLNSSTINPIANTVYLKLYGRFLLQQKAVSALIKSLSLRTYRPNFDAKCQGKLSFNHGS